jgi:tRNA (guanine-N7-)-methyltransferase
MRFQLLSPGIYLPPEYWTLEVPGATRTEIEIGPGDGRFLVEAARRAPQTAWVGLEVRAGLAKHLQARRERPENVRVYHCDARFVIQYLIADESIDAYHVYFPDPWWKKRHHKRRLLNEELAGALYRTLKPRGSVYLLTDVEVIFRDAAARLCDRGLRQQTWTRAADDSAQSSYERKYRRQARRLHEARFIKES